MREIKFRAWIPEKKRMIRSVGFSDSDCGRVYIREQYMVDDQTDANGTDWILMQFTGLLDKNGKEIYEEDIIRMDKGLREETICTVCWLDDGFVLIGEGYSGEHLYPQIRDGRFGEIIGNIYENPELLNP